MRGLVEVFVASDERFVQHEVADERAAQYAAFVHLRDGIEQRGQPLAILAGGLARAHHEGIAVKAAVGGRAGQSAEIDVMRIVAGETPQQQMVAEEIAPGGEEGVQAVRKAAGDAVGERIVVAEEFRTLEDECAHEIAALPVGAERVQQLLHGERLFLEHELRDDGQRVYDAGHAHDVRARDGQPRAALRGALCALDAAVEENAAQRVGIAASVLVKGVVDFERALKIGVQTLLIERVHIVERFAGDQLAAPFEQL